MKIKGIDVDISLYEPDCMIHSIAFHYEFGDKKFMYNIPCSTKILSDVGFLNSIFERCKGEPFYDNTSIIFKIELMPQYFPN